MRDIWLSAFGLTVTCRISEQSLKLSVSRDLVKEMTLDALAQVSNNVDLRLKDISISRNGFKAQFMPDVLKKDMSILRMRSNPRFSSNTVDGMRNWGGMFKKVENYLGLFYIYITENSEIEMNVPALELVRDTTNKSCLETTPRSVGLSPVLDRKRELYRRLFDEGIDDSEQTEPPEKPRKNLSRNASKRVTSQKSITKCNESKSSNQETEKSTLEQKPKGETPMKYRHSLIGMACGEEGYVPFGEIGDVLTYNPSKIGTRVDAATYIPEYVPTVREKKNVNRNNAVKYVPSKIGATSPPGVGYIPTELTSKSRSKIPKPAEGVTYKPSPKRGLAVDEYVLTDAIFQVSAGVSYTPSTKRSSEFLRTDEQSINVDEMYEPPGVTDLAVQYCPSQIASLPTQKATDSSFQLRTVRRKRAETPIKNPSAQKRLCHSKAVAPEKCLMPDWMFDQMKENQDRIDDFTYSENEIIYLDAEISRIESLKNLTESHIRYLFYKLEAEIVSVAVGRPRRPRHDLFMKEQSALLNNAIPIKAVSSEQLDLIKKLCLDHFNRKRGFQIFYVIQVLLPEVIIRFHMLVNRTTYEESDRQTDMGIMATDQGQTDS